MSKHRLINCEFLNASSFKVNVSNKAKLLYFTMVVSADDRGFVDSTGDLINSLTNNETEFDNKVSLDLIETTYNTALTELIEKGYIYEFRDNHNNKVHLIRHWFLHNKWRQGLYTNYPAFLDKVHLVNYEYVLGEKPSKENKLKEDKLNKNKINKSAFEELEEIGQDDSTENKEDENADLPF